MADPNPQHDLAPYTPVLQLRKGDIAERVIVCGDPARTELFSWLLEQRRGVASETFIVWNVSLVSHGVGGGSMATVIKEVMELGAKVIIRAGTCGSFLPEFPIGSLMIATSAVKRDMVTPNIVPKEFPAVATPSIVSLLEKSAKKNGAVFKTGMFLTVGIYEPYCGPLPDESEFWAENGISCVEMEASILFVISALKGIQCGCICDVDGYVFDHVENGRKIQVPTASSPSPLPEEMAPIVYEDDELSLHSGAIPGIRKMAKIALETICSVDLETKKN